MEKGMYMHVLQVVGWLLLVAALISGDVKAGDLWVDSSQASEGDGSFGDPYKTITHAMNLAVAGDTIKVMESAVDYNVNDNGESFPITVKHQVKIMGQGATIADYPRIGGDVDDSSVEALFLVRGAICCPERRHAFELCVRGQLLRTAAHESFH